MASTSSDATCILKVLNEFHSADARDPYMLQPTKLSFSSPSFNESSKRSFSDLDSTNVSKYSDTETPTKKSKEDPNSVVKSYRTELNKLKVELLGAKTEIKCLEQQIEKLHHVRKELETTFQSEKSILTKKLEKERYKVEELKASITKQRKKLVDSESEHSEINSSFSSKTRKLEKELSELRAENSLLKGTVDELEFRLKKDSRTAGERVTELEFAVTTVTEQLTYYKGISADLEKQLKEARAVVFNKTLTDASIRKLEQQVRELQSELESHKEKEALIQSQYEKVLEYSTLQKEVETLREINIRRKNDIGDKLLLEEEVENLKLELEGVRERETMLIQSLKSAQHAEKSLEEWVNLAKGLWPNIPADKNNILLVKNIRKQIEILREKELVLTDKVGKLESDLKHAELKNSSLETELQDLKKKLEQHTDTTEKQHCLVRRLQKKVFLLSRERDSYRSLVDSYEKDLTVSTIPSAQLEHIQNLQAQLEAKDKSLTTYQEMVEQLENELEQMHGPRVLVERLQKLEAEKNALVSENNNLLKRNSDLEKRQEGLSDGPSKTKTLSPVCILHPMYKALEKKHKEVQDECERLREIVEHLKAGEELNETRLLSSTQEVEELRNELKKFEIKYQRMTDIFKKSSKEFRDACYCIFGYSIERVQDNQYRLTSMYAESSSDILAFQFKGSNLDLLETPYSATLEELMNLHLHQHQSIPMFVSALTMELFQKQSLFIPEDEDEDSNDSNSGDGDDANDEPAVTSESMDTS